MPVTVEGEGRRWRGGGDATAAGKELARIGRYQKAYGGERAPRARAPVMAAGWRQGGLRTQQYSHVFFNVLPPTLGPGNRVLQFLVMVLESTQIVGQINPRLGWGFSYVLGFEPTISGTDQSVVGPCSPSPPP